MRKATSIVVGNLGNLASLKANNDFLPTMPSLFSRNETPTKPMRGKKKRSAEKTGKHEQWKGPIIAKVAVRN